MQLHFPGQLQGMDVVNFLLPSFLPSFLLVKVYVLEYDHACMHMVYTPYRTYLAI